VRFALTVGRKGDAPQALRLIDGLPAEAVMADTADDSDYLRQSPAPGSAGSSRMPYSAVSCHVQPSKPRDRPSHHRHIRGTGIPDIGRL
jgi:hypothetical protein